jgi:Peptidase family M28
VLAAVDGEEQGLYGSTFMAKQMAAAGNDVQGMFSNDIVGASQAFDGTPPDPHTVRLFVEGVPTAATAAQISAIQTVGGENDSSSRQLARYVVESAPKDLTDMNVRVVWRRDRYLRGTDDLPFLSQGAPGGRFTEPRENFGHEHQNVQVVDGVQLGDLLEFVDFNYVARVTAINLCTLWALASSPSTPKGALIHAVAPPGFPGTNLTTLTWNANPESNIAFYEVVQRETTVADWTSATNVGNVTTVTLDVSKDNVQFGIRAVDTDGRRSPVAFPTTVTV